MPEGGKFGTPNFEVNPFKNLEQYLTHIKHSELSEPNFPKKLRNFVTAHSKTSDDLVHEIMENMKKEYFTFMYKLKQFANVQFLANNFIGILLEFCTANIKSILGSITKYDDSYLNECLNKYQGSYNDETSTLTSINLPQ